MSNKYIVPIGVLIAAVLIIVGGFMVLNPHQPGSSGIGDNINDNESYVEPTQNFIPDVKVQAGELKRNADLQLKIGNRYKYEYKFTFPLNLTMGFAAEDANKSNIPNTNMKMSGSADIVVNRKERYNKSDVYVLKYTSIIKIENFEELMAADKKGKEVTQQEIQQMNMFKEGINTSGETWINNDGKTVKTITKMFGMEMTMEGEKAESGSMMGGVSPSMMIQPWMLALNENFEWRKETTTNMSGMSSKSTEKYKVTGVGEIDTKVGKKKCYIVEQESASSMDMSDMSGKSGGTTNTKISAKSISWVGYNDRILVKTESWMENLKLGNIELVDEKI
ncbi:MAG: hypothetical protein BWK75_04110 [Candidatus Altiarchaeales archaeon A3]|nr:MAG: hypothetical protein BWK75_04110 [Candidatus Altiarchaeales archaeon A3]